MHETRELPQELFWDLPALVSLKWHCLTFIVNYRSTILLDQMNSIFEINFTKIFAGSEHDKQAYSCIFNPYSSQSIVKNNF